MTITAINTKDGTHTFPTSVFDNPQITLQPTGQSGSSRGMNAEIAALVAAQFDTLEADRTSNGVVWRRTSDDVTNTFNLQTQIDTRVYDEAKDPLAGVLKAASRIYIPFNGNPNRTIQIFVSEGGYGAKVSGSNDTSVADPKLKRYVRIGTYWGGARPGVEELPPFIMAEMKRKNYSWVEIDVFDGVSPDFEYQSVPTATTV